MHDPPETAAPTRFDAQAASFDKRAGIPPEAAADIALGVLESERSAGESGITLELGPRASAGGACRG